MTSDSRVRGVGIVLLLLIGAHPAWTQQAPASAEGPGSTYASLRPQPKRLVDDWFRRLSAVVQKPVDPAEGYESLPLSTRTTFNAVTHALLMTRLTDPSGESLSDSAMDLVDRVDTVAGQILGSRSDQQFRLYVQLTPRALELLTRSKEFPALPTTPSITRVTRSASAAQAGHRRSSSLSLATRQEPTSMWITVLQSFPCRCLMDT